MFGRAAERALECQRVSPASLRLSGELHTSCLNPAIGQKHCTGLFEKGARAVKSHGRSTRHVRAQAVLNYEGDNCITIL